MEDLYFGIVQKPLTAPTDLFYLVRESGQFEQKSQCEVVELFVGTAQEVFKKSIKYIEKNRGKNLPILAPLEIRKKIKAALENISAQAG